MQLTDLINELTKPQDTTIYKYTLGIGLILLLIAAILDDKGYVKPSAITALAGFVITVASTPLAFTVDKRTVTVDYDIQRDKNYIYVNSHNDKMESAKLRIIDEDKQHIYVIRNNKTYKIPVITNKD